MKKSYRILVFLCLIFGVTWIALTPVAAASFDIACGDAAGLQAAVTTANSNGQADTINLAGGCTYTLTASLVFSADGGNAVTLNGGGSTIAGGSGLRPIEVAGANLTANNVVVSGGSLSSPNQGGGVLVSSGSLTMNGGSVTGNSSSNGGGVRVLVGASVTLSGVTVSGNTSTGNGGGISLDSGATANITGSASITNNTAANNGGGIASGGNLTFNSASVTNNNGVNGIRAGSGTVNFTNTTVTGNANAQCNLSGATVVDNGGNTASDGTCGFGASPTPTFTNSPTNQPTATFTNTPTNQPTATFTNTPTGTVTTQPTATFTNTPTVTGTQATLAPTATNGNAPVLSTSAPCTVPLPAGSAIYNVPLGAPAYFAANADAIAGFNLPAGNWYISEFSANGFAHVWVACQANMIWIPESAVTRVTR